MFKNTTPNCWVDSEDENIKLLQIPEQWESIPLLNVSQLDQVKENTLVRFQGMVQYMHNPEYFYEKFEVTDSNTGEIKIKNGKYCDSTILSENETVNLHSQNNVTSERHTMVLISIPGTNKWVEDIEQEANKDYSLGALTNGTKNIAIGKRTAENLYADVAMETENATDVSVANENKKICTEDSGARKKIGKKISTFEDVLNFPLSERRGKVCHAKIYSDADAIKLNNTLEIVGFVSFDAAKQRNNVQHEEMEFVSSAPTSLAPKIHCVTFRKIVHNNPLLRRQEDAEMNAEQKEYVRKDFLILLTQLLLGDEVAAQYLLFNLISRIFGRVSLQPLGKFSLNVSNIPCIDRPNYVKEVYDVLEMLLPKSHYFPMTLENMNTATYIPKKDYEVDCLRSGLLQLSDHTHLLLDETRLKDGTLQAPGVIGLQNIKKAIETQTVTYDFQYYPMEFDTDIPFLIFSEGKTLLSSDFHIKLNYDQDIVNTFDEVLAAAKHFMKPEFLTNARKYLTTVQHASYTVSEDMMEQVQQDFVNMRKDKKVTGEDLQNNLTVARMLSLSLGKCKLDKESWKIACELEDKRKESLLKR